MAAPLAPELPAIRPPRAPWREGIPLIAAALFGLLASGAVAHLLYRSEAAGRLGALLALGIGLAATALLLYHLVRLGRRTQAVHRQATLGARSLQEARTSLRTVVEKEAQYRLLVDHASDVISHLSPHGIISYVSPACQTVLGHDPATLIGQRAMQMVEPQDRPAVREQLRGGARTVTFRARHRDGHEVWLETSYSRVPADRDEVSGTVAISRDITARVEAERALRDSESLFRGIFENAAVGMAFMSPAGAGIQRVNPALAHMLGYSITELEEMSLADITHPADQHISPSEMQQVLAGAKEGYLTEKRYLHKNGSTIWVLGHTTLVRDADGEPRCFVSQLQDISERKRAIQRLARLSHQQDLILNATGDGIYGIDTTGHATFVNRAAAQLLGYDPTDLVGTDMHTRTHLTGHGERCRWRESRIYRSIRDGENHYVDDEMFRHRDGYPIPVQYVSSPIFDRGRAMGAVVVFSELETSPAPEASEHSEDSEHLDESNVRRSARSRR